KSKVSVFVDLFLKSKKLEQQSKHIQEHERHERHLQLAQLEVESLRRYKNLADSIPHAVWQAKNDGTMNYFNHVWEDYTGLSVEKSLGLGWQSIFEPEDLKIFLKKWLIAMHKKENFQMECTLRNHKGEKRWHLIRV